MINWASGRSVKIDPHEVGDLAVSLLRGRDGFQRKEVGRLADWLVADKPDVIVFSNILTAGCVPEIKRRMNVPVVVTLQYADRKTDILIPVHEQITEKRIPLEGSLRSAEISRDDGPLAEVVKN